MLKRILVFLLLNFGALAIGGLFTNNGVTSDWYLGLDKAPWTPPGWVFGAAWTLIMLCFTIYMAYLWPKLENKKNLIVLFTLQWVLNVIWNPIFFHFNLVGLGLITISFLTIIVGILLFKYWSKLKNISLLISPYLIWLLIATSLNLYIFLNN